MEVFARVADVGIREWEVESEGRGRTRKAGRGGMGHRTGAYGMRGSMLDQEGGEGKGESRGLYNRVTSMLHRQVITNREDTHQFNSACI